MSLLWKGWIANYRIEHDILDNLHIKKRYENTPKIIALFCWRKPHFLWEKINTNDSVRDNLVAIRDNLVSEGAIAKDHHGVFYELSFLT